MGTSSTLLRVYVFYLKSATRVSARLFLKMKKEKPNWLKSKGYLHLTPQINIEKDFDKILSKVKNVQYISRYAFFPLIHSIIKERKYKKVGSNKRAHSFIDQNGQYKKTIKNRPLHYATHMDAIIFGYYAEILQNMYEEKLNEHKGLSEAIIAYRRIPVEGALTNKSTIHFAHEIFEEIKNRTLENSECVVLAFDIKSFFSSLDHKLLKKYWSDLLTTDRLPIDHYNVFKAATNFSYIMRDDLRNHKKNHGKRSGFDERKLAQIRNQFGVNAFFESPQAFREKIKSGELRIYKYPFRNEDKIPVGIPQGLPISAILANLYLLNFDLKILDKLVNGLGCYYRRYSDDIAIICNIDQYEIVEKFVIAEIKESRVKISEEKTEIFHFKKLKSENENITSTKISKGKISNSPFVYLGFEYNGRNILIKSSNLSKFYRRMVFAVKRKARRAYKMAAENSEGKPIIYRRQLYKLYSILDLTKTKIHTRWKKIVKTDLGTYRLKTGVKTKVLRSNYFSYATRASEIMKEPAIFKQVRNHKKIFNQAIKKYIKKR